MVSRVWIGVAVERAREKRELDFCEGVLILGS